MKKYKKVPMILKKEFQTELTLFNKKDLETMAEGIAQRVYDGEVHPILAESWLYRIEQLAKMTRDKIGQWVENELDKYPEKTPNAYGLTFCRRAVSTKYDYSSTPEYMRLKGDLKTIEEFAQKAEKTNAPVQIFDEDGALRFTIQPAIKTQKMGYSREIVG